MAGGGSEDGEFGLQIAPMLDILFVLLLFFMVSAGSQKKEANLLSSLPGDISSGAPPIPINININANDEVSMNGSGTLNAIMKNSKTPSELELKLKSVVEDDDQQPIVICPSPKSTHQAIMDVLNACTGSGAKNVAFSSVQ